LILIILLIFLSAYLQPWAEYPSAITETALAKYCALDLKQQFIKETLIIASSAYYLSEVILDEVESVLPPRSRIVFHLVLRPAFHLKLYQLITAANFFTFYWKERCGKVDYWILCGEAELTSITVSPYISPGFFKMGPAKCDWESVLKIENNTPVVCFDCGSFYAVAYTENLVYVTPINGTYQGINLCFRNLTIPSSAKKALGRYASNISFNVSC